MFADSARLVRRTVSIAAAGCFLGSAPVQAQEVTYSVTQVYNQVIYNNSNPIWDTIFQGTFDFDEHSGTVSNLQGQLSQAMDGNTTWVPLTHPLSVVADGTDGLIVTVFKESTTSVFANGGFASTGVHGPVYTYGNFNAFATLYIPLADPTAALTPAQLGKLAYGDCTPAGLMPRNGSGTICMAGWLTANGGPGGTMQGTSPITQSIAAVPEPETWGMLLAGLGLVGWAARRRAFQ